MLEHTLIVDTHPLSVRQKCVSRDRFSPADSTRNMEQSTRAVTPLLGTSGRSTKVDATNSGPDNGSDCQVLQGEKVKKFILMGKKNVTKHQILVQCSVINININLNIFYKINIFACDINTLLIPGGNCR